MKLTRRLATGAGVTAVALSMAFGAATASAQDAGLGDGIFDIEGAFAGLGGVAIASADGGVVTVGDINSGLNTGNVIIVGVLE